MKFLAELERVLKADERFIGEDNNVIKTRVYDAAMGTDGLLVRSLLDSDLMRESFFIRVDDVYVFDKMKFVWVLESKEFLPDSYTLYRNKIGLVDRGNHLISQQQDVSLVWPYKDCFLEGGQTKEDQKREEIFYNETLAPDEVNRLLEPKVLGNARRYTSNGVEDGIDFNDNDNLIIKGNNLLALSSLLKRYEGKVKCIYIDPPYNTPSAANTFDYNNSFNHSSWLTFMKNRIGCSLSLLQENGFFVVAIDDNELFYLGTLCDELLGRENRLGVISVVHNPGGRQDEEFFPTAHENMIVYAKNRSKAVLNNLPMSEKKTNEYNMTDSIGSYKLRGFRRSGNNSLREERPNMFYPIFFDPQSNRLTLEKTDNSIEILPIDFNGEERCWRWDRDTFLARKKDYLVVKERNKTYDIYVKERSTDYKGEKAKTVWNKPEYTGQSATTTIKQIFGSKAFTYPKSEFLLKDIIHIFTNPGDLIIDFFMGSGTTHAAAHKMKRKYIGIEQMDYINTISVLRLKKVIAGEENGISKSVDWQGGGSFVYCELLEVNESLMKALQIAKDSEAVKAVLNQATKDGKLIPSVLPSDLRDTEEDFNNLALDKQKKLVAELLDKNRLYVNLSDLDDEDMAINEEDKAFTKSFYGLDGRENI
ncbi:MAG TPA: DNA methylase [Clostridiales bacterium]|jgi:adenine-specific DNA-methyltransferase|nr:DNA methylase [Clostridiales bacterium]